MLSKPQRSCSVQKKTKQQTQFMRISSNGGIRNVVDIRIFSVDLIFVNIPIFEHQNFTKKPSEQWRLWFYGNGCLLISKFVQVAGSVTNVLMNESLTVTFLADEGTRRDINIPWKHQCVVH